MLTAILKEPLIYFILLGAVVYALNIPTVSEQALTATTIELPPAFVDDQKFRFQQLYRRTPTQQELDSLLEHAVNEEILFREAWRLQLFVGDEVVRKRLIQKMHYILEQEELEDTVTEAEITQRITQLQSSTTSPNNDAVQFNLYHIAFNSVENASDYLKRLSTGEPDPSRQGNGVVAFPLGNVFYKVSLRESTQLFGQDFSAQLDIDVSDQWQGPVQSRYGYHVVKLDSVKHTSQPDSHYSRDSIRQDIINQSIELKRRKAIEALRSRYVVAHAE